MLQIDIPKTRDAALSILRTLVALLGLALVAAGLIDRLIVDLPISVPDGQTLAWYALAAAAVCWGCR